MSSLLDQKLSVYLPDSEKNLFGLVDSIIGQALEKDDLNGLSESAKHFASLSKVAAMANAKLLHGINSYWNEFTKEVGDTITDFSRRSMGYSKETTRKNIAVWEFLSGDHIPKDMREKFNDHTMRQLTKEYSLCVALKEEGGKFVFTEEDYELKHKDWLALAQCVDDAQTIALVQELKGKERNENYISYKVDASGAIWFFTKKESGVCGQLFLDHETDLFRKACVTLVERAKITEFENV